MRPRTIFTRFLAMPGLIIVCMVSRAAANPLITPRLADGVPSSGTPVIEVGGTLSEGAARPSLGAASPSQPVGSLSPPDPKIGSKQGVGGPPVGRAARQGSRPPEVAGPGRVTTKVVGNGMTGETTLSTAGTRETGRAGGRPTASSDAIPPAVGGVSSPTSSGTNPGQGLGSPGGVGAMAPSSDQSSSDGMPTVVGVAGNAVDGSAGNGGPGKMVGGAKAAGTIIPDPASNGPDGTGDLKAHPANGSIKAAGIATAGQATPGGPSNAGGIPNVQAQSIVGPGAASNGIGNNAPRQATAGANGNGPVAAPVNGAGNGNAAPAPVNGAAPAPVNGGVNGNNAARAPINGAAPAPANGGVNGNGAPTPVNGAASVTGIHPGQIAAGAPDINGSHTYGQAIGSAGDVRSPGGSDAIGRFLAAAVLSEVINGPGNTSRGTAKEGQSSSGSPATTASNDREQSGDPRGMNLPEVATGTLCDLAGLHSPLSATNATLSDPTRDPLISAVQLPAIQAGDEVRPVADADTSGGVSANVVYPYPIPEPSPLALLVVVAVASTGRATLRRFRSHG